jgi:hypothetical protein
MNGEVQLIVRSEQLSLTPTGQDVLLSPIVTGDSFCFGPTGAEATYTIGSKIEIIDSNVSPSVVVFTRYVTWYDNATGEITVDQPFTSDIPDPSGFEILIYSFIVADAYLDLYENESISQNWKFQDLSNFTAQGAFSREFRLPFSETNKEALGALFDNNVEQGAENYFFYKLPAEIRVDTLPIATGYLRVRKVYKQMGKLNEVEVAFYAETPDLVRTIGEKKLSDIAALADLNEAVTYANVTTETADRIWALCDRGQKWSNDGTAGSRPIRNTSTPIYPADLTPAVSWWFLLRNIVTEAGFDLVASSLENILNDYWMPFCNTPQLAVTDLPNQYFFRVYNSAPQLIPGFDVSTYLPLAADTIIFDNSGNFDVTQYAYTVPVTGEYTFNGLLKIDGSTVNSANESVNIGLLINVFPNIINYFTTPIAQGGIQYVPFTFTAVLQQGDLVALALNAVNASLGFTLLAGDGTVNSTFWEVISVLGYTNQTINYPLNAPDMRQIDFVNDVIKMHNCAIVPSRIVPNQIAIIPQNNYLGTGDVLDWTGKLDISKDVMMGSTVDVQKATFQFTYTAGEDAYSKLYKDANRVYGDFKSEGYTINPSTAPSDFAIGDQKIQLVTRSAPAAMLPGTGVPIQCFYNEQLEFVAPGPRCLYNASLVINVNLYNESIGNANNTTGVPVLNHYSSAYPNFDDYDLNWAPEVPPHVQTVQVNPYNNLFNLYWRNYMNEIYSPEGRIMEAFFALDLKDILTFSFADKIWIQDSYWRILEISDYKVGYNESTKVKLIKYLDQIDDCASTPVGTTVNGEVQFESGGDAVEPTEDCCSRYGYFWDEINGVCWAFNNGGQFRNSIVTTNNIEQTGIESIYAQLSTKTNSVINGEKVNIIDSNPNTLMVGKDLRLTKSVDGSNLLGKNVQVNLPGLHVGGGYRNGDPTAPYYGWAQFGTFVLQRNVTVLTSGSTQNLYIEGVAGEYINLPDDTLWSCFWNVTIKDNTGASETSIHHFTLDKTGGFATASAITTLNTIGAIGANVFAFGIDTTTNTAEHRINVTFTGGTYPDGFIITSSLQYQQNKTA